MSRLFIIELTVRSERDFAAFHWIIVRIYQRFNPTIGVVQHIADIQNVGKPKIPCVGDFSSFLDFFHSHSVIVELAAHAVLLRLLIVHDSLQFVNYEAHDPQLVAKILKPPPKTSTFYKNFSH